MALTTAAVIGAVGTVGSGIYGSRQARRAGEAQAASSDAAIAEQQRQFDTLLSLGAPQRAIGNQALATLGRVYGYSPNDPALPAPGSSGNEFIQLPGGGNSLWANLIGRAPGGRIQIPRPVNRGQVTINNDTGQIEEANYEDFFASPDYRFRLNQGTSAVQNSAAARGGLYSGNALRALSDYGQGTAAGEFGNWFNRQAALAGIGQAATTQAGNAALTTGANIGNLLVNQGNARASGIIGQTNSLTNMVNQLGMLWGSGAFGGGGFGSGLPGGSPTGAPWSTPPYWAGVPA